MKSSRWLNRSQLCSQRNCFPHGRCWFCPRGSSGTPAFLCLPETDPECMTCSCPALLRWCNGLLGSSGRSRDSHFGPSLFSLQCTHCKRPHQWHRVCWCRQGTPCMGWNWLLHAKPDPWHTTCMLRHLADPCICLGHIACRRSPRLQKSGLCRSPRRHHLRSWQVHTCQQGKPCTSCSGRCLPQASPRPRTVLSVPRGTHSIPCCHLRTLRHWDMQCTHWPQLHLLQDQQRRCWWCKWYMSGWRQQQWPSHLGRPHTLWLAPCR